MFPILYGVSNEYAAVVWTADEVYRSEMRLVIYILRDGKLQQSFILSDYFSDIREVQITGRRLAVIGYFEIKPHFFSKDLMVFDLKTGQRIISCHKDLNCKLSWEFVLQNERLLLLTYDGTLQSLTFFDIQ